MTGYSAAAIELDSGSLALELRSVNHRHFDLQLRVPDELRNLGVSVASAANERIRRLVKHRQRARRYVPNRLAANLLRRRNVDAVSRLTLVL